MNLVRAAIGNPVGVIVAVLMALMFGAISLSRLPVQMIPEVEQPLIQINTGWRAAAPEEVEAEIIEPQEDALRGVPGLKKMESSASNGSASVNLTFETDIDLERALIEVMNRMNRVPSYPADADEPVIYSGRGQFGSSVAWFALRPKPGVEVDIASYQDFAEEVVQTRIERVAGIANSDIYGGRASEIRITFDPYLAADFGIDIPTLANLTGGNEDVSGGSSDIGRRSYTLRFAGKFSLTQFEDMVIAWRDGSPVHLRDIATVDRRMVDRQGILSQNGGPSIAFNAQTEQNTNVLEVIAGLKIAVAELNEGPVGRAGLFIEQVYDESIYVTESITALRNNLLMGITLAVAILWWFLRKLRVTLIVALAIPVSLFVSFAALEAAGRTLNIISLAGLAFAMGMVLDAAIVVLENIVRLRESGRDAATAASEGATQVWPALVASTATTVAIFLPIMFLRDVAGQLFSDLAFTIAVAVVTSLVIAITIVPTAATTWLQNLELRDAHAGWWERGTAAIMRLTDTPLRRGFIIGGLLASGLGLSLVLLPDADYLPEGKQNFVFGFVLPPPGQSVDAAETEFTRIVDERLTRHITGEAKPAIQNYFLGVFGSFGFLGMRAEDPDDVDELLGVLNGQILRGFPDTLAFANRASIFGRLGGGREIDLNIQSRDLDAVLDAARAGMGAISAALPGANVRPLPGLELAEPELRLVPDERLLAEAGWTRRDMSRATRALGDGLFVGDYFDGERTLDIILRGREWDSPEALGAIPLVSPQGQLQPLGALVDIRRTAGPNQIRRVDRRRAVTLRITPPEVSLEEAIATLREQVEPVIRNQLPEDGEISYYGSADNLETALNSMAESFGLAIVILYLLMAALFRSFWDSFLVVAALPLATVGGVLALRLVDLISFQPMDLLTMIGFITLLGLVVNNAILLVHQTRTAEREGSVRRDAVANAVRIRLRPILMSTLTSVFGMLPLLLVPGAGTELYRGLAAVIVGGMTMSTLCTLVMLPAVLRLGETRHAAALGAQGAQGAQGGQYAQRRYEP